MSHEMSKLHLIWTPFQLLACIELPHFLLGLPFLPLSPLHTPVGCTCGDCSASSPPSPLHEAPTTIPQAGFGGHFVVLMWLSHGTGKEFLRFLVDTKF